MFISYPLVAQNTLGVTHISAQSVSGYTFFSPFSGTRAYLIDACGRLVNSWERGTRPGLSAYLLDDGRMLRTYKSIPVGPFTSASNAGGLELVDWDNNTIWQFEINSDQQISHHDAVSMPNGNLLVLTWKLVYADDLIELGRDPTEIAEEGFMWSENILEIKPIYPNSAEVVWEWNIRDHYIQDFDEEKQNFGIVADHPELFDINLPQLFSSNSNSTRDWNHFNSIDYHPELDQILLSVRNSDEIWILDHSTTIEEAAGHSGGRYGRGGDILYRWGNASAYQRAPASDQKLFGQHGAQWIKSGLENAGDIMLFNNGNGRFGENYSTVEILQLPRHGEAFQIQADGSFGPSHAQIVYGEAASQRFYAPYLSNAQRLDQGHILINDGTAGRIFEINAFGDRVWQYIVPLAGDIALRQGFETSDNWIFRAYHYPADFPGFRNIDLTSGAPIELNPNLDQCLLTSTSEHGPRGLSYVLTRVSDNEYRLQKQGHGPWYVQLIAVNGKVLYKETVLKNINFKLPHSGIFYLQMVDRKGRKSVDGLISYR